MMKKSFAFLLMAFLLAACGDDESSFAPRDDESSSSIEEESSSSVTPKSSEDETSVSSSSAKSSSSVTPQSSEGETSVSSSSSVKSSSSSEKSSSSVASSSSAKSSSSVTPQSSSSENSSSSVVLSSSEKSSSSYSHAWPLNAQFADQYKIFTDERNGRSYYYLTIRGKNKAGEVDSVTVMAENLNIGKMITYVKDQADDTTIERYCYDRDTTNCDRYGGLYQWAEMMQLPSRCNTESCADLIQPNHQGICPDGWRLLTQDDFYIVINADNNKYGIKGVRSEVFGGQNSTGYSLVGAGYVWDKVLTRIGVGTYWFYPEESSAEAKKAIASATSAPGDNFDYYEVSKIHGFSVRCVKVENQTE